MIIRKFLSLFLALGVVLASCEQPKEEARKSKPEGEKKKKPKHYFDHTLVPEGGNKDATGTAARFNRPWGIAVASDNSALYVADTGNHRIRKIVLSTGVKEGVVTTLAGSSQGKADGTGPAAQFNSPNGIAVSSDNSALYVADTHNHRIRKIVLSTGVVTTLAGSSQGKADGTGPAAQFSSPWGIALTSDDSTLYVADAGNHGFRKINLTTKEVRTVVSGSGSYRYPHGIALKSDDSVLYIVNAGDHDIMRIELLPRPIGGVIAGSSSRTWTGGGYMDGTYAKFSSPSGIAVGSDGALYVADTANHRIRKIVLKKGVTKGVVTTLAGSTPGYEDDTGPAAQFSAPMGIAAGSDGTLYVADTGNHRIRKIDTSGVVTTLAGSTEYKKMKGLHKELYDRFYGGE